MNISANIYLLLYIYYTSTGDWGLGIGDWGLGIGANAEFRMPNSQNKKHINNIFIFYN